MILGLDFLVTLSAIARWFTFVVSITGFLVALFSVSVAQRILQQSAGDADGERQVLARFGRASEALSVAAQFAFVTVGISFVLSPPTMPTSMAQAAPFFDGILRTAGFGFGALVLTLKSALNLVIESSAARPRLMRREAYVAELERANRKLDEAARAKSAFLANMSHELRTPLNAILGFSDLLLESLHLKGPELRYLHNIQTAGAHLLDLINDVLDLSRVEAGKLELRPEVVALATLLEPVCASTAAAAKTKGITLTIEGDEAPIVFLDATRIRQVLYNLLSNAVKFTPSGGTVRLRTTVAADELHIEVIDTGVGIPPESKDKVFGLFERLHEATSSVPGTGLGLALTKRLVELHGGTISFESRPGVGTTFRVNLPNVQSEPVTGERLLVVEDERNDAELITALADKAGLRVEIVRSLAQARAAFARNLPVGVVLDLKLPDGRGEQFLQEVRGRSTSRPMPVIVVTVETDENGTLKLGVDDYLTKPIERGRLERWLNAVARSRSHPAPQLELAGRADPGR